MPWNDLPLDVLVDILSRLPVKTLIRFRCVRKSWKATISHPIFITTHLNRASASHSDGYLQCTEFGYIWYLLSDQAYAHPVESGILEIPFDSMFRFSLSVVGSINGLVCLSSSDAFATRTTIYLWNPSIGKLKALPPSFTASQSYSTFVGFGFHPQTNDYKVVRILYSRYLDWRYNEGGPPLVEVYALSTNSWRKIEGHAPWVARFQSSNAFINGSVHWLASTEEYARCDRIMSFDIADEVFREMKLPDFFVDGVAVEEALLWLGFGVLKDSLSLCVSFPSQSSGHCYIWVMREYGAVESWTKQFTIVAPDDSVKRFQGFTKNNELILETCIGELFFYDLESLELKYRRTHGNKGPQQVVPFVETLVLLEGGNAGNTQLEQENSIGRVSNEGIHLGKRNSRLVHNYKHKALKERKRKIKETKNSMSSDMVGARRNDEYADKRHPRRYLKSLGGCCVKRLWIGSRVS